jgi:hypothetical protein
MENGAGAGERVASLVTTIDRGRIVVFDTLEARQDAETPSFVQVYVHWVSRASQMMHI